MGGINFPRLNSIALQIWKYCEDSNLTVFASYIRSADNGTADAESREAETEIEYELSQTAFTKFLAVRSTNGRFIHFKKKLQVWQVLRLEIGSWCRSTGCFYCPLDVWKLLRFPSLLTDPENLTKNYTRETTGILVVPNWPGQPWFPLFQELLASEPVLWPPSKNLLLSANRNPHPLADQLFLVAGIVSGRDY